jgi:hypothetical protein
MIHFKDSLFKSLILDALNFDNPINNFNFL